MTDTSPPSAPALPIDARGIAELLPHRYPFLLVDRVTEFEIHKRLRAYKNVTINEPFFQGHFPGHPVVPGVLIIEALAQAAGLLVMLSRDRDSLAKSLFYLAKVNKARFSQIVTAGDQVVLEVELKRTLRSMCLFWCRAYVDGKQVAEAEMLCAERRVNA